MKQKRPMPNKANTDRPKKEYLKMIAKTASLIRGRTFKVKLSKLGIEASGRLFWEQDDYPDIGDVSYKALDNTPHYFKHLLNQTGQFGDMILLEDVCGMLPNTAPFKQMDKEIKAVCKESDEYEKNDPEFDWLSSVLEHAIRKTYNEKEN